jgi:hypothetical protein
VGEIGLYLLAAVVVGIGLLLLGAIFRFSIISSLRARKSRPLLRTPDLEGVQQVCGFQLPVELARLYREAPFIEQAEFALVDTSKHPPAHWTVGAFNALTPAAVREARAVSGVSGVPIADDLDKGVYFVDASGAVMLASPNVPGRRVLVAASIRAFSMFQAREVTEDDA